MNETPRSKAFYNLYLGAWCGVCSRSSLDVYSISFTFTHAFHSQSSILKLYRSESRSYYEPVAGVCIQQPHPCEYRSPLVRSYDERSGRKDTSFVDGQAIRSPVIAHDRHVSVANSRGPCPPLKPVGIGFPLIWHHRTLPKNIYP